MKGKKKEHTYAIGETGNEQIFWMTSCEKWGNGGAEDGRHIFIAVVASNRGIPKIRCKKEEGNVHQLEEDRKYADAGLRGGW